MILYITKIFCNLFRSHQAKAHSALTIPENQYIVLLKESCMQQKNYYPTISHGWILLVVIIGYNILGSMFMFWAVTAIPGMSGKNSLVYALMELTMYTLVLGATIGFAIKQLKRTGYSLPVPNKPKLNIAAVIIAIVMVPFMIVLLDPISMLLPMPQFFKDLMAEVIQPNIISFIAIGIAPAILEEVLFRGIVLKGMLKNYSPTKAILWSSFFFAIFHLNPWQAVPAFLIGIFIGWIYYRTRSLLPGMLLHGINNSIAFLAMVFYPEVDDTLFAYLGYETFSIVFIVSVAVFIAGCWMLNKLMPPPVNFVPEYIDTTPEGLAPPAPATITPTEQN